MIHNSLIRFRIKLVLFIALFFLYTGIYAQPGYRPPWIPTGPPAIIAFGIHFDPIISWFTTDSYDIRNDGALPGFNFGVSYNRYIGPNYSISSGVNIIEAGGRLISKETTYFELKNYRREIVTIEPGEAIIYRIKYLSVPLGLKLQTSETGYGSLFADIGLDPKIVIGGRADIPSLNIKGDNALLELRAFNLSYHIMAGIEYPLGGSTSAVFGLGFDNNFLDITKENSNQPWDYISHKLLSFRLGINF
jgi:hypothetical protein